MGEASDPVLMTFSLRQIYFGAAVSIGNGCDENEGQWLITKFKFQLKFNFIKTLKKFFCTTATYLFQVMK